MYQRASFNLLFAVAPGQAIMQGNTAGDERLISEAPSSLSLNIKA